VERNYSPHLHPIETGREYQRALNSVKMERIFAKPLIGSLDGHSDSVQSMVKHPTKLSIIASGDCNGVIKLWNITHRKCIQTINGHKSIVRGICAPIHGQYFFSCDDSQNIKQWSFDCLNSDDYSIESNDATNEEPINTIIAKSIILGMDNHKSKPLLITCGDKVDLWEESRTQPLRSYQWGVDSVNCIKFNPIEFDICVGSASDRSIILYDTRKSDPLRKVVLQMRTNALSWNPMEAFVFTAANEDNE